MVGIVLAIAKPGNLADETTTSRAQSPATTAAPASTAPTTSAVGGATTVVVTPTTALPAASTPGAPTTTVRGATTSTTAPKSGSGLGQSGASKADAETEVAKTGGTSMLGVGLLIGAFALLARRARRAARLA